MALATVCTLVEVCSEAAATTPAWRLVADAVDDIDCAVVSMVADAVDSPPTSSVTLASKARVRSSSTWARRILTSFSASCSAERRSASILLCLNTPTAAAIAPISSLRSAPGIAPETSPLASCDIVAVSSTIGRQTRRRTMITRPTLAAATAIEPCERDQEAEARRRSGRAKDLLGVVVEGVAHADDRAKTFLRFREEGVGVVLVFAADRHRPWPASVPGRSVRHRLRSSVRAPRRRWQASPDCRATAAATSGSGRYGPGQRLRSIFSASVAARL